MNKTSELLKNWKEKKANKKNTEAGSFYVAGVTFENRQEILESLEEEYYQISTKKLARFIAEPDNQYDINAIKVEVEVSPEEWKCIGYVPKTVNQDFKRIMDSGRLCKSKISSIGRPESDKPLGAKVVYEVDLSE